jgi:hypothetical protein
MLQPYLATSLGPRRSKRAAHSIGRVQAARLVAATAAWLATDPAGLDPG